MRHGYREFIDQIRGKTKVFGYNNTIINQISVISWFHGEFYFSKVFTRRITWIWISFNILGASIVAFHSASYIFLTRNLDISTLLTCNEVLITMISLLILAPIGSYVYRNSIADTLQTLDRLELHDQYQINSTIKRTWIDAYVVASLTILFFCSAYIGSTYYDLITDYDVNKLSNPNYYAFPLYCENIDTLGEFLFATYLQMLSCIPISAMYFMFPFYSIIVMKEFKSKFQILCSFLDAKSELFEYDYENLLMIDHDNRTLGQEKLQLEDSLLNDIHSSARYHHRLLRGLSHLRLCIEYYMSISLFFFLYVEIFLIYLFTLMKDDQILHKARYIEHAINICVLFVVNCWVGSSYTEMGEMFEGTVYNIPWYYLSSTRRKSIHLLLYQAQVNIHFNAWKIYPLDMAFFMRSCKSVYSIVNLLRRGITHRF